LSWPERALDHIGETMHHPRPAGLELLPDPVRSVVSLALEQSERVTWTAVAVGCTLVLTDRRLLLVRDGTQFRPRSGLQTWALDRSLTIRLTPNRERLRLMIECCGKAVSVFVAAVQTRAVVRLVAEARHQIYAEDAPPDSS
jgi:hypothetical protein